MPMYGGKALLHHILLCNVNSVSNRYSISKRKLWSILRRDVYHPCIRTILMLELMVEKGRFMMQTRSNIYFHSLTWFPNLWHNTCSSSLFRIPLIKFPQVSLNYLNRAHDAKCHYGWLLCETVSYSQIHSHYRLQYYYHCWQQHHISMHHWWSSKAWCVMAERWRTSERYQHIFHDVRFWYKRNRNLFLRSEESGWLCRCQLSRENFW